MGIFNKRKEADKDANRDALFAGRASPSGHAASASENPYAAAPPPYDRPSSQQSTSRPSSALRPTGMSRQSSARSEDPNRGELFRGAARPSEKGNMHGAYAPASSTAYGSTYDNIASKYVEPREEDGREEGYNGAQQEQQVDEDDEVEGVKQQLRYTKQESVSSTRNALRMANEAEESGRATLSRLGTQSDMFASTEKNLDMARAYNRTAADRAKELKTLNRSMFAVHVDNPFTKARRTAEVEERINDRYALEQMERDETRAAGQAAQRRVNSALDSHAKLNRFAEAKKPANLIERSRYQFEADEEDDGMEKEIDANLSALGDTAGRLRHLALATNEELTGQNKQLDKIGSKGDRVGAGINLNTERLKRIR